MLILNFIFLQHQRSVNSVTLKQQQHLLDRRETAAFTLIYSLVLLQMDGLPSMAFSQCSHDPFQYKKKAYTATKSVQEHNKRTVLGLDEPL